MWTTFLVLVAIAVVVFVAMRAVGAASSERRNRPTDQPEPVDATQERRPPTAAEDPGPDAPSGGPVPGSREDRERHGKP